MMHVKFLAALACLPALASASIGELTPPAPDGWKIKKHINKVNYNEELSIWGVSSDLDRKFYLGISVMFKEKQLLIANPTMLFNVWVKASTGLQLEKVTEFKCLPLSEVDYDVYITLCGQSLSDEIMMGCISDLIGEKPCEASCPQTYKLPIIKSHESAVKPSVISRQWFVVDDVILPAGWKYEWSKEPRIGPYGLSLTDTQDPSRPTATISMDEVDRRIHVDCNGAIVIISQGIKLTTLVNQSADFYFDSNDVNIRASIALGGRESVQDQLGIVRESHKSESRPDTRVAIIEISPAVRN